MRIFHHKTGEHVWLPLEHNGQPFYPEREAWLSSLLRHGIPIILLKANGVRPYSESCADHLVQRARKVGGLPRHVTRAACRHGGMTELGDAELMSRASWRCPDIGRRRPRESMSSAPSARGWQRAHSGGVTWKLYTRRTIVGMARLERWERESWRMTNALKSLAGAGGIEPPHGGIKSRNAELKP